MKLLLYDMGTYTQQDIMVSLQKMGIDCRNVMYRLEDLDQDAYFAKRIDELLISEHYDAVFSVNYFPVLADICLKKGLPYLSWSYDSPLNIPDIERTLGYETNHVFFFDREECRHYWQKGYKNICHLPLAVNTDRLDKIVLSRQERKEFGAEISMVGQLYETVLPDLMLPLDEYDKGFLSAVVDVQLRLYGAYLLEDVITDEFVGRMNAAYAAAGQTSAALRRDGLIVTAAKHITHMERLILLDILSEKHKVDLWGPGTDETLSKVRWRKSAGYFDTMPKIFKSSKINLNISLKCIASGIPLRALDILGCGGFLLTNYQPEIAEFFEDGTDLVMYTSLQDAAEKCDYYLEHEDERRQIAKNGYEKVKQFFGYESRLKEMLKFVH